MTTYTRKSHIVRIGPSKDIYIDMEVLDAISFRHVNGEEMVLNLAADKAVPYITDDTGDGNAKKPTKATRRSHMKRISNPSDSSQFFDIEVLDAISFRDANGKEWIMDMQKPGPVYNTTDGTGDPKATRRVHTEKIYSDPNDKTSAYMTVTRCDNMAFRTINGEEMVITMPSHDDGKGPRAATYSTPTSYVPNGDVTPPANKDPSIYAFFPPNSTGAFTGDAKVECGPLWWPRGMSQKTGAWYWFIPAQTPYAFSLVWDVCPKYVWTGDPSSSSFASEPGTLAWRRETGILTELPNTDCVYTLSAFGSFGYATLDDAILRGTRGDWGVLGHQDTRIDPGAFNGLNKDYCIPGISGEPDNWQIAGTPAPALVKPAPGSNKFTAGVVTPEDYARLATAFAGAWNATSNSFNIEMAAACISLTNIFSVITWPDGTQQRFRVGTVPSAIGFPSSSFGVPLIDPRINRFQGCYIGGLPNNFYGDGFVDVSQGAYASYIGMSQLDPKKWDTSDPNNPKLRPTAGG